MNIKQVKTLVMASYKVDRPVCMLSSPGIGKSSAVYQCGEELAKAYDTSFGMIEVRAASSSPAELEAIKYVHDGSVHNAEQDWVPTDEKVKAGLCPERGFIFCDEITGGMPTTQSVLQKLFLDRKLGGLTLAKGWATIAAGNRAKDKSAAGNLSRAFLNRCAMVTVNPDPDVFFDWGLDNGIDHRIMAFVRFQPECVNDGLEIHRGENQAFCSPRSLHIASDFLREEASFKEALLQETLQGVMGDGYGSTFSGFLRIMNDLPDLDGILKDPEKYPVPEKTDVAWATVGALANRAKPANVQAIMKYFVRLSTEISVVAIKDLAKMEKSVFRTKEFKVWSADNIKFAI